MLILEFPTVTVTEMNYFTLTKLANNAWGGLTASHYKQTSTRCLRIALSIDIAAIGSKHNIKHTSNQFDIVPYMMGIDWQEQMPEEYTHND